jgi:hypothetical protein
MAELNFQENIFTPYPLKELSKDLKKKHSKWSPVVRKMINEYVKTSGEGFSRFSDLLIKLMEDDLDIYNFTKEDEDELKREFENIDKSFKHISVLLDEMSEHEQKKLWVDKYDSTVKTLYKLRSQFLKSLLSKELWKETDSLILTYYDYLISTMSDLTRKIDESHTEDANKLMTIASVVSLVYGSVLLAYDRDKLKTEVLVERLSELSAYSEPLNFKVNKKVKSALENSKNIPSCLLRN